MSGGGLAQDADEHVEDREGSLDTGVWGKKTPPEKKTPGKTSLKNTKSGTGEHLLR